jgi:hypothetical protein
MRTGVRLVFGDWAAVVFGASRTMLMRIAAAQVPENAGSVAWGGPLRR